MLMYFNQSLRGLSPGAPVDFRGVVIGEVKSIGVEFDRSEREFRMPVLVQVYPDRLRRRRGRGSSAQPSRAARQTERLQFLVGKGLRAQLRTGNLLTGPAVRGARLLPQGARRSKVDVEQTPDRDCPRCPTAWTSSRRRCRTIATQAQQGAVRGDRRRPAQVAGHAQQDARRAPSSWQAG